MDERGVGATGVEPAFTFTLSAGYKPEGIRPGWPPRSRTERYLRIRQAPSTGWVAASGRWKCRSRGSDPARAFKTRCRAGGAPSIEEGGGLEPQRARPGAFETPPAALAGSPSKSAPPPGVSRSEMTEDGVLETHPEGPPGFRPGPAAWLVHPPRKAADSNGTVLPRIR